MMIVPALAARSTSKPLRVAVLDRTGSLREAVEEGLRAARFDGKARFDVRPAAGGPRRQPRRRSRRPSSTGRSTATSSSPGTRWPRDRRATSGRNVSNRIDLRTMERSVSDVLVGQRLTAAGLDPGRSRTSRRSSTSGRSA